MKATTNSILTAPNRLGNRRRASDASRARRGSACLACGRHTTESQGVRANQRRLVISPAAAVACGQATIGLGTDTAGSIRIPASYQGLWGVRTTHGRISRKSIHPLSESFDTVGWMTRDAQTLAFVAKAMMLERKSNTMIDGLEICPALDQCVEQDVREPFVAFRASIGNRNSGAHGDISTADFISGMLDGLVSIFQIVRGYEAWQANGEWVSQHWSSLAPEIAARFRQSPTARGVHGAADFLIFQQNPYCYATRNNSTGFLCYCYI